MANKRLTIEECQRRTRNVNPHIHIVEYTTMYHPVLCECQICGHQWEDAAKNLFRCSKCPMCNRKKNNNRTTASFREEMVSIDPTIIILGAFQTVNDPLLCKCSKCGREWMAKPSNLLLGKGCSVCKTAIAREQRMKSHEQFVKEMFVVNPDVDVVGRYTGAQRYIGCRCKVCGHRWSAKATNLLSGYGCPGCTESSGEQAIRRVLTTLNIEYEFQKRFADLKGVGGHLLSYDFFLPRYNTLIEYQGQFHDGHAYQQTREQFQKQVEHDWRKRTYAVEHGYILIELWYYDFKNIENNLISFFNNYSSK